MKSDSSWEKEQNVSPDAFVKWVWHEYENGGKSTMLNYLFVGSFFPGPDLYYEWIYVRCPLRVFIPPSLIRNATSNGIENRKKNFADHRRMQCCGRNNKKTKINIVEGMESWEQEQYRNVLQ